MTTEKLGRFVKNMVKYKKGVNNFGFRKLLNLYINYHSPPPEADRDDTKSKTMKLLKQGVMYAVIFSIMSMALAVPASAALNENDVWGSNWGGNKLENRDAQNAVGNATGLGNQDPRATAAKVINVILGFLGIIAVILILAGGFMWMTAAGNEDKVATAKKVLSAGVIGLVIVLAAFGIAKFVLGALMTATQ